MSTSYNDQWVLERPRPEHHEHAGSHGEQPRTLRELSRLRHLGLLSFDGGDLPAAARRRRGYRQAMQRHRLQHEIRIPPGDYTEESGATAGRSLLQDPQLPTAIFAANDRCAHGVLDTLTRARVDVPGDVSVVGYDDSDIARLSFIDLTTIRQDATQMAEHAVQAIVERLDQGRTDAREIVLDPTLVVRGTTGPPRSDNAIK